MIRKTFSLADQVYERLESEILSGKYQRGEILTELRLVEDLGVSRTPIREAVRLLEQEHIVEVSVKGITVLGVTQDDLRDIYEIRLATEPMAAQRAALCADEAEIAELRKALELQEFYVSRGDSDAIKTQDSLFHEIVYQASHSGIFFDTLLPLHKKVQKFRKASVENRSRAAESVAEHRDVFAAIEARDGKAAYDAMLRHVTNARNHIVK